MDLRIGVATVRDRADLNKRDPTGAFPNGDGQIKQGKADCTSHESNTFNLAERDTSSTGQLYTPRVHLVIKVIYSLAPRAHGPPDSA